MGVSPEFTVLSIVAGILVWACLGVWAWVFLRKRDGLPILPVARRRPVPWRGWDILVLLVSYIVLSSLITWTCLEFFEVETPSRFDKAEKVVGNESETALIDKIALGEGGEDSETWLDGLDGDGLSEAEVADANLPAKEEREHAITLALRGASPGMIAFCILMAVIFAPLIEEIVFRMFLQGYLEKLDTHFRLQGRRIARYRGGIESRNSFFKPIPWGVAPMLIVSAVFAMMHFRVAAKAPSTESIRWQMTVHALSATMAVIFLLFWLRLVRGARLSDFGIVPREIPRDIVRGFVAFLAIAAPVYAVQLIATEVVPKNIAPDPLPIFILSLAFGTVWCRTHRLVPSIVMHMSLNATSMGMAIYFYTKVSGG